MESHLKVGSEVSFLTETGKGKILEIAANKVKVEDEFGFEKWYSKQDLVPVMQLKSDQIEDISIHYKESSSTTKKSKSIEKSKEWVIDLHLENLVDSNKGMSNHEIVLLQLKHFKNFLQEAEKAKVAKILVIHGQGTGKLKSEIKQIVDGIKGAEMYDANYLVKGPGASYIERKFNWR